jgi:hypothetical protein
MSEGPSIREMFLNLSESTKASYDMYKEKGILLASTETVSARIDTCSKCEFIMSTMGIVRCKICGCGLMMKVRLAPKGCPKNFWLV